jgi:MoaA/NifB/PqqE/SkfB family radical SAM enzyme
MKNALTYLTRKCPRKCDYCRLRDSNLKNPELKKEQWVGALSILKDLGVDFNLILGNETWLLGEDLLYIMERNQTPFALYTTCPENLFEKYRDLFFSSVIDNLSCGVDYPLSYLEKLGYLSNDMEKKSYTAWKGLLWTREHYPNVDTHGTITINRSNKLLVLKTLEELTKYGIFTAINFIHWDKGGFDFFPPRSEIEDLMLDPTYIPEGILQSPGLLQNPQMFTKENIHLLIQMGWHCLGDPYGGPTIDADGSLRCCGYRAGERTSKLTIFDLPNNLDLWKRSVSLDCFDCPGCGWSFPWQYKFWEGQKFANQVFIKHAGKHIKEELWSKRKLEGKGEECVE